MPYLISTRQCKRSAILILSALVHGALMAGAPLVAFAAAESARDDQAALSDLLSVIDDVSALATRTRLNADFVPGILTVLHGEELVALGVQSVWEALALVPGVQIARNNNGALRVFIRGLQHGNGNIKLLLNAVAMNNAYSGYANILSIPVEQVQRIEVIRGPGSAVYGEFAFAGVVNIVTRQDGNRIHLRVGSGDAQGAGSVFSMQDTARDLRLSLNVAGWETEGSQVMAGTDRLYALGLGALSRAPGPVGNAEGNRLAVFTLDHGDFSLLAQYNRSRNGPFFGAFNVLPAATDSPDAVLTEQTLIQLRQGFVLAETLGGELKFSWWQFEGDWREDALPPGTPYPLPFGRIYPDGVSVRNAVRTSRGEAALGLNWSGWKNHRWRFDLSATQDQIDNAWWSFNGDLSTLQPVPVPRCYTGAQNFIDEDSGRSILSLAAQDEYRFNESLDLTASLRYDRYSDVDDNFSPRLAAVWRLSEKHLFKAQYARAFFPPSLLQIYGNPSSPIASTASDAEAIATTELGYILRSGDTVARLTLFHSQVKNLIVIENSRYLNRGRARLQGAESEWEQQLGADWKLAANLSYTDALDEESDGPLAGAARWLGNLSLLYRPQPDILLSGHWRYVGERQRATDDSRQPLAGTSNLGLTLNWFDAGIAGLTFRAGIRNLLGETIKSPAPINTYRDDYPLLEERIWWVQLSYQFR